MIEATTYFENGVDVDVLVNALETLPESVRPIYFAEDEGKVSKDNRLDDKESFRVFLERNAIGFFLYAENGTCIDISTPFAGYAKATLNVPEELANKLVRSVFCCLADLNPVFGYACEYEEYKHRNRYYVTFGKNHIEDWIGRKLERYISGVYWHTLISDKLLARHGIKLSDLITEAEVCEPLGNGAVHLLKFFENPKDWKDNSNRLDDLCERIEGMFSRRSVEAALVGVTNFLQYDEVIANWR